MDLTIPLKGSTTGPQYAGWQPRALAVQGLGNRVLAGQRVPVADDVTLNADVYTPKTPGRYPAASRSPPTAPRPTPPGSRPAPTRPARPRCSPTAATAR